MKAVIYVKILLLTEYPITNMYHAEIERLGIKKDKVTHYTDMIVYEVTKYEKIMPAEEWVLVANSTRSQCMELLIPSIDVENIDNLKNLSFEVALAWYQTLTRKQAQQKIERWIADIQAAMKKGKIGLARRLIRDR